MDIELKGPWLKWLWLYSMDSHSDSSVDLDFMDPDSMDSDFKDFDNNFLQWNYSVIFYNDLDLLQ